MTKASFYCTANVVGRNLVDVVIPVPDNWTEVPLHVVDSLGQSWPTEQRRVSDHASGRGRTIQLVAQVISPSAGIRNYTVEEGLVPSQEAMPDNVAVLIQAEDHQGTTYSGSLMTTEECPVVGGEVTKVFNRRGEMRSSSNARFLGFDAQITKVAGETEIFLVQMALQNGTVGAAEILHHLYFNEVRLSLPVGYMITHEQTTPFTSSTKLITQLSDGTFHFMPMGHAKDFRFAIHTAASAARAQRLLNETGFGVCNFSKTEWAWDNPETAFYGPQAEMALQHNLVGWLPYGQSYGSVSGPIAAGLGIPPPFEGGVSTPMGPYHARHNTSGADTGGTGITGFPGYEVLNTGSVPHLKNLKLMQMMSKDREQGLCLVGTNQLPIDPAEWDLNSVKILATIGFWGGAEGPFQRSTADQWRFQEVQGMGKLPYYHNQLLGFNCYDIAHSIRPMGPSVALAFLKNDYLAKVHLAQWSAWGRMYTYETGPGGLGSNPNAWLGYGSLFNALNSPQGVQNFPGKGWGGGRIEGWCEFAVGADYILTDSSTKRANAQPWLEALVDVREAAQLPSGFWHEETFGKPANDTNNSCGVPAGTYSVGQNIEHGIELCNGLRAIQVITQDPRIEAMQTNACNGLWNYHWDKNPGGSAPIFTIAVRPGNKALPAYTQQSDTPPCAKINGTDNYQIAMVAIAALKINNADTNAWNILSRITGKNTPQEMVTQLQTYFSNFGGDGPLKMASGWGPMLAWLMNFTSQEALTFTGSLEEQFAAVLSQLPPAQQSVLQESISAGLGRLRS